MVLVYNHDSHDPLDDSFMLQLAIDTADYDEPLALGQEALTGIYRDDPEVEGAGVQVFVNDCAIWFATVADALRACFRNFNEEKKA